VILEQICRHQVSDTRNGKKHPSTSDDQRRNDGSSPSAHCLSYQVELPCDNLHFIGTTAKVARNSREPSPRHHIAHVEKTDEDVVVPMPNETETKTTNLALLYGISPVLPLNLVDKLLIAILFYF
jgi:hypothetical protein